MIPEPKHGRKLVVGEVSLTLARLKQDWGEILDVLRDNFEKKIVDSNYFKNTPFTWVVLMIRYGVKNQEKPEIGSIDKKYGVLQLRIEVDVNQLLEMQIDDVPHFYSGVILRALNGIRVKYDVPKISL